MIRTIPNALSKTKMPSCYKQFFAWGLKNLSAEYEQAIAERKQNLLGNLQGHILEIGPGTGANLPYYPTGIHWIGVEPNPFMHDYLREKAEALGLNIELHQGTAERLPVDDNQMDAVVSTLVLCSVPDLAGTLAEIVRVLKPGGQFMFIEHVVAGEGTLLRQVQRGIRPVWKMLGDGCHPDRETWKALEAAGFAQVDYEHFSGPVPIPVVKPHIIGVATKSAG